MSHASNSSAPIQDRYYFLLRRLHSLSGIIPVGVFLVIHLLVNATVLDTPQAFQDRVDMIHSLGVFLVPVEIVGIFIPILFHALLGVKIMLTSRPNPMAYSYAAGWRYALQRWTGMIAFVFIMAHLWHMHWLGNPFGGGFFDPHDATRTAVAAMQQSVFWAPFYAVGVLASVYHFANGIWTALITWGLTVGTNAQRKAGYVCAIVGVGLAAAGLATIRELDTAELAERETPVHAGPADPGDAVVTAESPKPTDPSHIGGQ